MYQNGVWYPDLFDKQWRLLQLCRLQNGQQKSILLCGPKWSGKSISAAHAIVDHCWNTEHASVAVVTPSISSGQDSGFWNFLTEKIIPQWIAGEFGMTWAKIKGKVRSPGQDGTTKKLYCVLTNKFGGTSRIQLNSIKEERDIEKNFFNTYFSMIYVSEAALTLTQEKSYTTLLGSLRILGVPEEKYVLLLDTNPAKEGADSYLYKLFYVLRVQNPDLLSESDSIKQRYLHLQEIYLDDNVFLSEEKKNKIKSDYESDPDLYARYVLGQWKKASKGALFADVFKPAIHVVDETGLDHDLILPQPDCEELMTSWDFGPVNPVVVFCEEFPFLFEGEEKEKSVFKFFDEIAFFGEMDMSLGDFTGLVVEKMDEYERLIGHPVHWLHYSDRSAFDVRESISNIYQYQEVYAASNERIELQAVDKRPGSVPQAIRLWRKLLLQQRLLFSGVNCPKLVEMNQSLSSGINGQPLAKGQLQRHPFDAARYLVTRRCWQEMMGNILTMRRMSDPPAKVIAVPL